MSGREDVVDDADENLPPTLETDVIDEVFSRVVGKKIERVEDGFLFFEDKSVLCIELNPRESMSGRAPMFTLWEK